MASRDSQPVDTKDGDSLPSDRKRILSCTRDNVDGRVCHCNAKAGDNALAKCKLGKGDPYDPYLDEENRVGWNHGNYIYIILRLIGNVHKTES